MIKALEPGNIRGHFAKLSEYNWQPNTENISGGSELHYQGEVYDKGTATGSIRGHFAKLSGDNCQPNTEKRYGYLVKNQEHATRSLQCLASVC